MQIVRTILWLLILFALLVFSWANWDPGVTVRIWDGIVVDTRLPAVVLISFLAGLVPMWLYHRGVKWRMARRIKGLEEATRVSAIAPAPTVDGAHHPVDPATTDTVRDPDTPNDPVDRPASRPALP